MYIWSINLREAGADVQMIYKFKRGDLQTIYKFKGGDVQMIYKFKRGDLQIDVQMSY